MFPPTGAITAEPEALETKVRLLLAFSVPEEIVKAPVTEILLFNILVVPECATVKFLVFIVFVPATVTGHEKLRWGRNHAMARGSILLAFDE